MAESCGGHNCDPAGAGRKTVRAAPEAPGTGPGPRGSPWRPPPRASGSLLPAGCDRRAPELRVAAGVARSRRAPRLASDVYACPAPGLKDPERPPLRSSPQANRERSPTGNRKSRVARRTAASRAWVFAERSGSTGTGT